MHRARRALHRPALRHLLGERLDRSSEIGRRVLDWPGDPGPFGDAVALRLCGGLHFLARNGGAPGARRLYPPAPLARRGRALGGAGAGPCSTTRRSAAWLDRAPQTNEVGRSAVLMSGLLVIAARFGLPLRLYELGASAGLNLQLDRYGYDLGGLRAGDPGSPLQLKPDWRARRRPRRRSRIDRTRRAWTSIPRPCPKAASG